MNKIFGGRDLVLNILTRFARCENGATTVEWVALASGLTIGAIVISFIIMDGLVAPAQNIATQLSP